MSGSVWILVHKSSIRQHLTFDDLTLAPNIHSKINTLNPKDSRLHEIEYAEVHRSKFANMAHANACSQFVKV